MWFFSHPHTSTLSHLNAAQNKCSILLLWWTQSGSLCIYRADVCVCVCVVLRKWLPGRWRKQESCLMSRSEAFCQWMLYTGPHSVLTINWRRSGSERRVACLWLDVSHDSLVCACKADSHMGLGWLGLSSFKMTCQRLGKSEWSKVILHFKMLLCTEGFMAYTVYVWWNTKASLTPHQPRPQTHTQLTNAFFFYLLCTIWVGLCWIAAHIVKL